MNFPKTATISGIDECTSLTAASAKRLNRTGNLRRKLCPAFILGFLIFAFTGPVSPAGEASPAEPIAHSPSAESAGAPPSAEPTDDPTAMEPADAPPSAEPAGTVTTEEGTALRPVDDLQTLLSRSGIDFVPGRGLQVDKEISRGDRFTTIIAGDKNTKRARFEITRECSPESAEKIIFDQEKMIEGMHGAFRTGYPGMITKQIDSPDELKPVKVEAVSSAGPVEVMILRASERFTYGLGDPSQVFYTAVLAFFYSTELRMLVQVELFYPVDGFEQAPALEEITSLRFKAP